MLKITQLLLLSKEYYPDFRGYVAHISVIAGLLLFLFKDYLWQKFFSKQNAGVFLLSLTCLYLFIWIVVLLLIWFIFTLI